MSLLSCIAIHCSAIVCASALLCGCATTIPPTQPVYDDKGCVVPEPNTFKKVGFSLELAKSKFGSVTTDAAKIAITPEIVSLVSQATRDHAVVDYLRCRVTKSYPADESQWYSLLFAFADTKPSAEQMTAWQADHPSPAELRQRESGSRRP